VAWVVVGEMLPSTGRATTVGARTGEPSSAAYLLWNSTLSGTGSNFSSGGRFMFGGVCGE
jgi:hypothetical protein